MADCRTDNTRDIGAGEGARLRAGEELTLSFANTFALPTRRSLIGAMGLGMLAGCNPFATWALQRFYTYRVELEVDGVPVSLSNAGVIVGTRGAPTGGGSLYDISMPSAKRLPTGEALVVQPPSIIGAIRREVARTGSYEKITRASYEPYQIPSVFFLDSPTAPTFVDAYIMRAANTATGNRVPDPQNLSPELPCISPERTHRLSPQ